MGRIQFGLPFKIGNYFSRPNQGGFFIRKDKYNLCLITEGK